MQVWGNIGAQPDEMLPLTLDDIGFVSGVVIVERLRTFGGKLLDLNEHAKRFQLGCRAVGIELPGDQDLQERVLSVLEDQRDRYAGNDFSVILLATPGRLQVHPSQPTLIIHSQAISWKRLAHWYGVGQALAIASTRSIPENCWSPKLKTRARLHYYMADQEALTKTADPFSAGLLLDQNGYVTETSSANVLLVEGKRIISPRRTTILDGISLGRTLRLAERRDLKICFEDISEQRAKRADALWLCGSTGCMWPAASLDERVFEANDSSHLFTELVDDWKNEVGLDFVAQALASE